MTYKLTKDVVIKKGTKFEEAGETIAGSMPLGKEIVLSLSVPNNTAAKGFKRLFGAGKVK